jgi:signal transduction histidine kinase
MRFTAPGEDLQAAQQRTLTDRLLLSPKMPSVTMDRHMVTARRGKPEPLLENFCSRLGTLLERQYTGLALLSAKHEADAAAKQAKEAMLEAKAADLAKTKFLANMAHELRTPLNAIIGFSEIIKLNGIQKERYPEYAEYIHDAGILLLNIINGLLDLARIQAGKVDLEDQLVGVDELLQSVVRTIAPIAQKKSIDITFLTTQEQITVFVDQTKFRQVLLNLLSNGVKFTEPSGRISIGYVVDSSGDMVISIKDTGIGIPPEHLQRVLNPFEQVADHLTKENEGSGLGLPIARALMELHGGELILNSTPGIGTIVFLRLPHSRVNYNGAEVSG